MNTIPSTERRHSYCAIPLPNLIYAGPETKEEFDLIDLPETVHDWKFDNVKTVLKRDGHRWETRCHSKCIGNHLKGSITVIFQWFDERPIEDAATTAETQAEVQS